LQSFDQTLDSPKQGSGIRAMLVFVPPPTHRSLRVERRDRKKSKDKF